MTLNTCKQIEYWLVDYTDKLLDSDSSKRVTEHLRQCESCRCRADALKRSLALTRVIWQDTLEQTQERPVGYSIFGPRRRQWVLRGTAVAAILFLAASAVFRYMPSHPASPQLTAERVEFQIEAEASAARLLATAELLAHKPHAQALAQQQYQYLLDHYPATRAGIQARTHSRQEQRRIP